jgi:prefoldin subunit 5
MSERDEGGEDMSEQDMSGEIHELRAEIARLKAEAAMIRRVTLSPTEQTWDEVKALEPGNTGFAASVIDAWNARADREAKVVEIGAVDAIVAERVSSAIEDEAEELNEKHRFRKEEIRRLEDENGRLREEIERLNRENQGKTRGKR